MKIVLLLPQIWPGVKSKSKLIMEANSWVQWVCVLVMITTHAQQTQMRALWTAVGSNALFVVSQTNWWHALMIFLQNTKHTAMVIWLIHLQHLSFLLSISRLFFCYIKENQDFLYNFSFVKFKFSLRKTIWHDFHAINLYVRSPVGKYTSRRSSLSENFQQH